MGQECSVQGQGTPERSLVSAERGELKSGHGSVGMPLEGRYASVSAGERAVQVFHVEGQTYQNPLALDWTQAAQAELAKP